MALAIRLAGPQDADQATIRQVRGQHDSKYAAMYYPWLVASTPGSAIAVCAEQADGSIRLTVQDHGQGIPADKLARVVEPFYMVDKSRSRRQGGSGLGLALCSRIAQAHGGTLAMESELGKGTTVTVTLPAPNQTAAELAQEEPV